MIMTRLFSFLHVVVGFLSLSSVTVSSSSSPSSRSVLLDEDEVAVPAASLSLQEVVLLGERGDEQNKEQQEPHDQHLPRLLQGGGGGGRDKPRPGAARTTPPETAEPRCPASAPAAPTPTGCDASSATRQ